MLSQTFFFTAIVVIVLAVSPPIVLAQLDPIVIEELFDDDPDYIAYTVINPNPSSVGDIVGILVELNPDALVGETVAQHDQTDIWLGYVMDNPAAQWDDVMGQTFWWENEYNLTWQQFFGGIDYPFSAQPAVAFFYQYEEVSSNVFSFIDPTGEHSPISPGESIDEFRVYIDVPQSEFIVASISDPVNDTFGADSLPTFQGETIPEPGTLLLLGLGATLLRRKR